MSNLMCNTRKFWSWLFVVALIALSAPAVVLAAPPAQDSGCAQEYTVQAGDYLSSLAKQYLGSSSAYAQIADATNAAHEADPRFAQIGDHNVIQVGWLLCIPAAEEGTPAPAEGAQPEAAPIAVQFDASGTVGNMTDTVKAGEIDRYAFTAAEGQLLWSSLMSDAPFGDAGPAITMAIWGKDGTVLISDHAGATDWNGTLPIAQEYYVDVMSSAADAFTYTLGIGLPAPVQADPNLTQTEVVAITPSMPEGEAKEGDCWTSSNLLLRADAWRCNVGDNEISDPCFTVEGNSDIVICGIDPVKGDAGFQLKLTKPLPMDQAYAGDPSATRTDALYVKLADGKVCSIVGGATFGAMGQRANFSCFSDENAQDLWIFGDLMPGAVWQGVQGLATTAADGMPTGTDLKVVQIATVWQ